MINFPSDLAESPPAELMEFILSGRRMRNQVERDLKPERLSTLRLRALSVLLESYPEAKTTPEVVDILGVSDAGAVRILASHGFLDLYRLKSGAGIDHFQVNDNGRNLFNKEVSALGLADRLSELGATVDVSRVSEVTGNQVLLNTVFEVRRMVLDLQYEANRKRGTEKLSALEILSAFSGTSEEGLTELDLADKLFRKSLNVVELGSLKSRGLVLREGKGTTAGHYITKEGIETFESSLEKLALRDRVNGFLGSVESLNEGLEA